MDDSLFASVVQIASSSPSDAQLRQFCADVQEAEHVSCGDRQRAVDYLVGELERRCSPARSEVLMTLLYAVTDIQRFPEQRRTR